MATENKRLDNWPALVPKVGQVVQLQIGSDTFETAVISRATQNQEVFRITVADPYSRRTIALEITPSAVDMAADRKPYWRVFLEGFDATYLPAMLYFID